MDSAITPHRAGLVAMTITFLVGLPAFAQPINSETSQTGLDDADFRRVIESGPANSVELELAVTTYAQYDMHDEVVAVLARYLGQSGWLVDTYCRFCRSLLPIDHGHTEPELTRLFFEASDLAVEQSIESGSIAALVRLAMISSASNIREHRDRALYFLTTAAMLGIDDTWRDEIVGILANLGFYSDALAIAESAFGNPASEHHQSETLDAWIRYLRNQIDRDEQIGRIIATAATR